MYIFSITWGFDGVGQIFKDRVLGTYKKHLHGGIVLFMSVLFPTRVWDAKTLFSTPPPGP